MARILSRLALVLAALVLPLSVASAQIKVKVPKAPTDSAVEVEKPNTPSKPSVPDGEDVKDKAADEAVDKAAEEAKGAVK